MTPLEKAHGLFVLLEAQLHDLSPTLEIAVLTSLRALIAEREHDLRNALAAQTLRDTIQAPPAFVEVISDEDYDSRLETTYGPA
jgi:hypothetical protein